jgi:hypothetical protein
MFVDEECITPHKFIAGSIPDRAVGAVPFREQRNGETEKPINRESGIRFKVYGLRSIFWLDPTPYNVTRTPSGPFAKKKPDANECIGLGLPG